MPEPRPAPDECANCGASIPRGAKACPECGADERTGWRETSIYDGLDLPEDSDTGNAASSRRQLNGVPWYWWLLAALVLLAVVVGALGLR